MSDNFFSGQKYSYSNFNYENYESNDSGNNCFVDENGDLQEMLVSTDDNVVKQEEYKYYTGDSVFGEEYCDNDYEGWNG